MRIWFSILIVALAFPASAQSAKGDPVKARKALERALDFEASGKLEDAFKACSEAIEANVDLATAWRLRGKIRWQLGETEFGERGKKAQSRFHPDSTKHR